MPSCQLRFKPICLCSKVSLRYLEKPVMVLYIEYPNKQFTPYVGMSLMKRFIDQTDIRDELKSLGAL